MNIKIPSLAATDNDTLNRLLTKLGEHTKNNEKQVRYYEYKALFNRELRTGAIPERYYKLGLILGWCPKAIDLLKRRCNYDQITSTSLDLDTLGWAKLERANAFSGEISNAITESLIHGVSFLAADLTTAAERATGAPDVLVHTITALNGTGDYNERLRRLESFLAVTSRDKDGHPDALTLWLPGRIINATKTQNSWQSETGASPARIPVEPLVYRPRAGKPLGQSRINKAMMALQDKGLRILVRLEGHGDVYSLPQWVMLGLDLESFTPQSFKAGIGQGLVIPDDEDTAAANPRAEVKQISANSPEPHLADLNAAAKLFAREASLPDTALAITDIANPTSAESYDSSQYELIHEAEGATNDWAAPIARTVANMLALANSADPSEYEDLAVVWRNPRYLTRSAAADAGAKILGSAPELAGTRIGYEMLGLTTEQINRALTESRRNRLANLRTLTPNLSGSDDSQP
jgi:hypothetical protein